MSNQNLKNMIENHKVWLLSDHTEGSKADFSFMDLSGCDLSFSDLREADFSSVNLTNTDLSFCDLRGANFYNSSIDGALIAEAVLS